MKKRHRRLCLLFDRSLSKSFTHQMAILGVVFVVALALSYLLLYTSHADLDAYCRDKNVSTWALPFYLLIDANALNTLYAVDVEPGAPTVHGWMLTASTVVFILGMFIFNGMIISLMTNAIEHRVRRNESGLIHYLRSGHYIIMGYDDMVPSVIANIFSRDPSAYVLLMSSVSAETIRERLGKSAVGHHQEHIIVNYGHRTTTDNYADILLEQCEELFIVGNRSLPAHDATNVECVDCVCSYLTARRQEDSTAIGPHRITCVFEDPDTYAAFQNTEIFQKVEELGIAFVPYNFYAGWARQVLVNGCYRDKSQPGQTCPYPALYGKGIAPDDDVQVHLVLVGTTMLNVQVAIEAAHMLHFPNYKRHNTLITFIERNAAQEQALFKTRNRYFFSVHDNPAAAPMIDMRFEFVQGDIFAPDMQQLLSQWAVDPTQRMSIFLAMADQRLNFAIGMNMPDAVYDEGVPVFIRQDRSDNFVSNLRHADAAKQLPYTTVDAKGRLQTVERSGRYAHIYPFGMNDVAFVSNDTAIKHAKLINYLYATADYAEYRFTSTDELATIPDSDIWNKADEEWNKLTVALKWSSLYCAYNIPCRLATLRAMRGLSPDDHSHDFDALSDHEVDLLARTEHNRWCVEKLLMGFRPPTAAEDKYRHPSHARELSRNKKLFIHHDLRPYDQLDNVSRLDTEIVSHMPWIIMMEERKQRAGKTETP